MEFGIDLGGMYESPAYYLDRAESVEAAGFDTLWFGDHIQPWFHTGGRAPFAWSWMPAAMERTDSIPVGVFVTPPLYRYHPLVIANAVATIDELYPGRFLFGVGTGERMNEHPFVDEWPSWDERGARLKEAIAILRQYWTEDDFFGFDGDQFSFDPVYPYEQPEQEIPVYVAASGPKSARLAAEYGDHIITIAGVPNVKERVIDTYREHGGDGQVVIQTVGGYGDAERIIDRVMESFASTLIPGNFDETDPRALQASTDQVSRDDVRDAFLIAEEPAHVLDWMDEQADRGADHVVVTDVSYEQDEFYRVAADDILPAL
ncbi:TIGR03557 family F420-dependent LLM class oxidoreductase [Haladaptatus halobius]|uniref:TIGR03557 family F420-dependent LLM class oxidoreductase n=1 Tax=Haladaptatus halobius TaxID=2884875 RepID=UPI001D0B6988|nr:TIGR03557 family F420-dependent LLM class oxidoreductase [Haladaptatus halobius]